MRDIDEELLLQAEEQKLTAKEKRKLEKFVNAADHGVFQSEKEVKKKPKSSTLCFNKKQYELFNLVRTSVAEVADIKSTNTKKFIYFIWMYHINKNRCNPKDYVDYVLFLSQNSNRKNGDFVAVLMSWDLATQPIKEYPSKIESSLGHMSLKGAILLLVLHYAKNELDIDLSEYQL